MMGSLRVRDIFGWMMGGIRVFGLGAREGRGRGVKSIVVVGSSTEHDCASLRVRGARSAASEDCALDG